MLDTPARRVAALAILLVVLAGLFVSFGALDPAPDRHAYPDEDDLAADYDAHVGGPASLGGTVVATDPVTIEVGHDRGTDRYTVRGAPDVEEGQYLRAFGTVEPERTLAARETVVRDGWEAVYMWAVSVLAALWVLGRAVRHWRVDSDRIGFRPRLRGGDHDG